MTKGYWTLETIRERWGGVDADTARAWLADCDRMKIKRRVLYAIEGVLTIEAEATFRPAALRKPPRKPRDRQQAMHPREAELRRHFGV